MYRRKTTVIIVMCVAILFMGVGYAILSTKLNINGSTAVTSTWKVEFSGIRVQSGSIKGGATSKSSSATGTTAKFEVDLVQPGDELTYEIDITNYGDIVAEIKGASYTVTGSEAIYVKVGGVRKGTTIGSCEGLTTCPLQTMTITVGYDPGVTMEPTNKVKEISITLDVGQYVPGNPTPDEELLPKLNTTLATKILNDNVAQSDSGIDFGLASGSTNGKGLYYTSTNTEDNKPTYYFRGDIKNNYVIFANKLWRIIRINEDGSVRLIKNDLEGLASISSFNSSSAYNAHVGFMYGTANATSYALEHANTNSSPAKQNLDSWYTLNLSNFSSYLADAGFCGDRSLASGTGYGSSTTTFAIKSRIEGVGNEVRPQFKCPQTNDLYTTKSSTKGNKALTNPIGLITADELVYLGAKNQTNNYMYPIVGTDGTWTMTPYNGYPAVSVVSYRGTMVSNMGANYALPVINLKSTVKVLADGKGTANNPYVVA